ncbi:hypothetical protein HPB47_000846 [Ixodes persulcatus]|uniref:Uncharacterized protein n=1 Tax=Ixodes persulcatus TaxID=34615 RepID=A0AC60PQL2_IXOPE|nr:hypothetical protein HPB47_000846 [Ixodes persulcatus]
MEALEVPEICGEILCVTDTSLIQNLQSKGMTLADLPLKNEIPEPGVNILIGSHYYWKVTTGSVKRINSSLAAVETIFGLSLQGPGKVSNASNVCTTTAMFTMSVGEASNDICSELRKFWELESLGIRDSPSKDQECGSFLYLLKSFNSSVKKIDGRYEAQLL